MRAAAVAAAAVLGVGDKAARKLGVVGACVDSHDGATCSPVYVGSLVVKCAPPRLADTLLRLLWLPLGLVTDKDAGAIIKPLMPSNLLTALTDVDSRLDWLPLPDGAAGKRNGPRAPMGFKTSGKLDSRAGRAGLS